MVKIKFYIIPVLTFLLTACSFGVKFEDLSYKTGTKPLKDTTVIAVISKKTQNKEITVKSFAAGETNSWIIEAGQMLKQFTDEVMPQYVEYYTFSDTFESLQNRSNQYIIEISFVDFKFYNASTNANIRFKVYNIEKNLLLNKSYQAIGTHHNGEMWSLGIWVMEDIIRESTLSAYEIIFKEFKKDLIKVIKSNE